MNNKLVWTSILVVLVFGTILFGQFFVDPAMSRILAADPNLPPSLDYPLGTQSEGRDVLVVLALGAPMSLMIGLIGGSVALLIGTVLGFVSGYLGGIVDAIIRTIVDVGLTIPAVAVLILIAASFPSITIVMMGLVIAFTSWMQPTRVIRAQVLSLREREFVRLAKLSGVSNFQIIFFELPPNLVPLLASCFVNAVSTAMLASIGLEVLGLGPQHTHTLGGLIYQGIYYNAMWRGLWWWWMPAIFILVIIFLVLFFLSLTLDEISNPRFKRIS